MFLPENNCNLSMQFFLVHNFSYSCFFHIDPNSILLNIYIKLNTCGSIPEKVHPGGM